MTEEEQEGAKDSITTPARTPAVATTSSSDTTSAITTGAAACSTPSATKPTTTSSSSKNEAPTPDATKLTTTKSPSSTTTTDRPNNKVTRRSARVLDHDPIVAPGFGTQKDVLRLSQQLSSTKSPFPPEAVLEMMSARGRGLRSNKENSASDAASSTAASASVSGAAAAAGAGASNSLWADFMKEEGVTTTSSSASKGAKSGEAATSNKRDADAGIIESGNTGTATTSSATKKRFKASAGSGLLVQTGTLDCTIVGRGSSKKANVVPAHHLMVPTVILPSIQITRVFTSCNAVHSIAIDTHGNPYGWGRNENQQLGSHLPDNVVAPTRLLDGDSTGSVPSSPIASAAMGKSHTLLLTKDGNVWAVGANKAGQCSIHKGGDTILHWKQCTIPSNVTISQIASGEDFSVALDESGTLYTTGSSEFGQLANGETGEYFITASKLAFANCPTFTPRRMFVHSPAEKLYASSSEISKTIPLDDSSNIALAHIACGKHHGIAVEKVSDGEKKPRVFSWGCGNYGCLGHGVQADEYFPRMIGTLANVPYIGESDDIHIAAGAHCSLLQTSNGHVYYWGKHRSVGEATMRPTLVDALANNEHVVTHSAAGGQTVVCCTNLHQCVAWGQGPHGELGLGGSRKSSAKPAFVTALDGKVVLDLACGYGHTLFVVEDAHDMPKIQEEDMEALEQTLSRKSK